MFTAIKKATETDLSFAALSNVIVAPPTKIDSQESFWMAETLKWVRFLGNDMYDY